MVKVGDLAPDFSLPSTTGQQISLSQCRGRTVVLFFYPKDNTPGCTQEACDLRDHYALIRAAGAEVLGVSKDSTASHRGFSQKYQLPFTLLTDADNAVATQYGAYGEKVMYGRKVMGTIRSTFIIGPDGRIVHKWSKVKVDGHIDAILEVLGVDATGISLVASAEIGRTTPVAVKKSTKKARSSTKKAPGKKSASPKTGAKATASRKTGSGMKSAAKKPAKKTGAAKTSRSGAGAKTKTTAARVRRAVG